MSELKNKLQKTLDTLKTELKSLRVGRANAALVEDIKVDAYNSKMPLREVASISVPQHDQIFIQPWDKSLLGPIEKALRDSDANLNPAVEGEDAIRITIPPLTEETRKNLAKDVHKHAEEARIAIRNIREDFLKTLDKQKEDKSISEDEYFDEKEKLQETVNEYNNKVEEFADAKESEIMER